MLHSQESGSSVFFHSQEEGGAADPWGSGKDSESGFPSERTPELLDIGGDLGSESDLESGELPLSLGMFTCSLRLTAPPILILDCFHGSLGLPF